MTDLPLYRYEAICHKKSNQYGTIILARPASLLILTICSIFLLVLAALLCFTYEFSSMGTLPGLIIPKGSVAKAGDTTASNQPLATIPDSRAGFQAVLYVSGKNAGSFKPGKHINIRYRAYPYQKFGQYKGIVANITPAPLIAGESEALSAKKEGAYRIDVELERQGVQGYGQTQALRAGMEFDASFEREKKTIGAWLFEPLINLAQRR